MPDCWDEILISIADILPKDLTIASISPKGCKGKLNSIFPNKTGSWKYKRGISSRRKEIFHIYRNCKSCTTLQGSQKNGRVGDYSKPRSYNYWLIQNLTKKNKKMIKYHSIHIQSWRVCFPAFNFLKISDIFHNFRKLN